jgi:hypothetical protein
METLPIVESMADAITPPDAGMSIHIELLCLLGPSQLSGRQIPSHSSLPLPLASPVSSHTGLAPLTAVHAETTKTIMIMHLPRQKNGDRPERSGGHGLARYLLVSIRILIVKVRHRGRNCLD